MSVPGEPVNRKKAGSRLSIHRFLPDRLLLLLLFRLRFVWNLSYNLS